MRVTSIDFNIFFMSEIVLFYDYLLNPVEGAMKLGQEEHISTNNILSMIHNHIFFNNSEIHMALHHQIRKVAYFGKFL